MDTDAVDFDSARADLWTYVDALGQCFPHWFDRENRESYLFRTSAVIQALGVLGHDVFTMAETPETRATLLARVSEKRLDWRKNNLEDWEGVIGHLGKDGTQVVAQSSRPAIDATISLLRKRSGIAALMRAEAERDQNA